jgi:biopolymer transport protein ExbD
MRFAPPRRDAVDITLTPLIDILFIVLLFLVLTATFTEQTALRVSPPRAATGMPHAADPGLVRIQVDADGNIAIDSRAATMDDVERRLEAIADKDLALVSIAADARASHGRVIEVVDRIRRAGIFRLDIETFAAPAARGTSQGGT